MSIKLFILCVVVASVCAAPQSIDEQRQMPQPISEAIASTINTVSTAITSANDFVASALGSIRVTGTAAAENAVSSATTFINDSTQAMSNRITSITNTLTGNTNTVKTDPAPAAQQIEMKL